MLGLTKEKSVGNLFFLMDLMEDGSKFQNIGDEINKADYSLNYLLVVLPEYLLNDIFNFLQLKDVVLFDSALLRKSYRERFLLYLRSASNTSPLQGSKEISASMPLIAWVNLRGICLRNIVLTGDFGNITDQSVELLSTVSESLEYIGISDCAISDLSISKLLKKCSSLKSLDLWKSDVGTDALTSLAKCTSLKSLYLGDCKHATDSALTVLSNGCSEIESLEINDCDKISGAAIAKIVRNGSLEKLNLQYLQKLDDLSMCSLAESSRNLKILNVYSCELFTNKGLPLNFI